MIFLFRIGNGLKPGFSYSRLYRLRDLWCSYSQLVTDFKQHDSFDGTKCNATITGISFKKKEKKKEEIYVC